MYFETCLHIIFFQCLDTPLLDFGFLSLPDVRNTSVDAPKTGGNRGKQAELNHSTILQLTA